MRRRRVAALRGRPQRRLHDARPAPGAVGARGFDDTRARWNIVGQQLLLAELEHRHDPGRVVLERRLGRLPAGPPPPPRRRRRRSTSATRCSSPATGTRRSSTTSSSTSRTRPRRRWPPSSSPRRSRPAATAPRTARTTARWCPYNPHIKYYEGDRRGYLKATVTRNSTALDLRFVTSVQNPERHRVHRADLPTSRTVAPAPRSERSGERPTLGVGIRATIDQGVST